MPWFAKCNEELHFHWNHDVEYFESPNDDEYK